MRSLFRFAVRRAMQSRSLASAAFLCLLYGGLKLFTGFEWLQLLSLGRVVAFSEKDLTATDFARAWQRMGERFWTHVQVEKKLKGERK